MSMQQQVAAVQVEERTVELLVIEIQFELIVRAVGTLPKQVLRIQRQTREQSMTAPTVLHFE